LFFGAKRLPEFGRSFGFGMKVLSEEAARLAEEDETKQLRNNEAGKEIAPNAGKGERSV
jgi:Sec-independent protein translocase protein TatA